MLSHYDGSGVFVYTRYVLFLFLWTPNLERLIRDLTDTKKDIYLIIYVNVVTFYRVNQFFGIRSCI